MNTEEKAIIEHIQKAMNYLYDSTHPMPKAAILQELSTAKMLLEAKKEDTDGKIQS